METTLVALSKEGGEIQKVRPLDLGDEDWAAIVHLPLSIPRPVGSAVLYPGDRGRVEVMLFQGKNPDFKSVADLVITFIFEKEPGGVWSARVREEPSESPDAPSGPASSASTASSGSGCLIPIVVAIGSALAAGGVAAALILR